MYTKHRQKKRHVLSAQKALVVWSLVLLSGLLETVDANLGERGKKKSVIALLKLLRYLESSRLPVARRIMKFFYGE